MSNDYLVLNRNDSGEDVIHRNPRNECNTEAEKMDGREVIDAETADAMLLSGLARRCLICNKEDLS
jgi:hypothetical protein